MTKKHKRTKQTIFLLLAIFLVSPVFAADEDLLFSDGDMLFSENQNLDFLGEAVLVEEASETDLSLSNLLLTNSDAALDIGGSYSFVVTPAWSENFDTGVSQGGLSMDLRAKLEFSARPDIDTRIYGRTDISYLLKNGASTLSMSLTELFSDFNISDTVFFRVGKQTLTWGVGYFFSPADLLNSNSINPLDAEAEREGTVAIKANMPLGVDNIYTYVKVPTTAKDTSDLGYAAKYEKVIGQTELGFGTFYQKGEDLAAMVTLSSGIGDISLFGEAVAKYDTAEVYFQGTIGSQFSWVSEGSDFGFSFVGQYYYNGDPIAISSDKSHFAAVNTSISLTDTISIGAFWIGSLCDSSGLLKPSVSWNPNDKVKISFSVLQPYGGYGNYQNTTFSIGFSLGGANF